MKKRAVVALGGNALGNTPEEQAEAVVFAAAAIADLIEEGYQILIGHGNGPQVGMIHQALNDYGQKAKKQFYMPFAECTAMSQGYIGFHLQRALEEELRRRNRAVPVASLVTQIKVDPEDPAFLRPEKPIGAFCSQEEAEEAEKERGWTFTEDAGRGYRRVVPSPRPVEIVEIEAVRRMLDAGIVVITAGGGGIPVTEKDGRLTGAEAVIDKDRACERLAEDVDADVLLILTAVDRVCIHYGSENQRELVSVTADEAERYMKEGHFAPGSMRPKVEAAILFARSAAGRRTVITSLEKARGALSGNEGTLICG